MRVTMKCTKEGRREGEPTMQKGTIWNVSEEQGAALVAAGDAVATPDVALGKATISSSVIATDTHVSVTAYPTITAPEGQVAQTRIASIDGTRLAAEEPPTARDWAPFTRVWRFDRPAKGQRAGRVTIVSQCTGYAQDEVVVEIPAIEEPAKEPTPTKSRRAAADTASEG